MLKRFIPLATCCVLLSSGAAHASLFGEENGPLLTLVAQAADEITQLQESLRTARQTYDETKKYVGLAADAINGFNQFKQFGQAVLTNPTSAVDMLLPDAAYLRRELSSPANWAGGTGELQRQVRMCFDGSRQAVAPCAEFHEAVQARQAQLAIERTFGAVPAGRDDVAALDIEAATVMAAADAAQGRAAVAQAKAKALLAECLSVGNDAAAMQECQAAAATAQILATEAQGESMALLAEATRLQAVQVAQENQKTKQAINGALQRTEMVKTGVDTMMPQQVQFQSPYYVEDAL